MSKKRFKKSIPEKFDLMEILPEDIKTKVKDKLISKRGIKIFNELLTGVLKTHIKGIYINRNVLYAAADNPLWANEFKIYKRLFLSKLQKQFHLNIKDIVINFKPEYFKNKIDNSEEINLTESQKAQIESITKRIKDNELRKKLQDFLKAYMVIENKKKKKG